MRQKRVGSKLNLSLGGKVIPVQIKETAVNTLNNEIYNINFQALTADQTVNSVIHIILKNAEKITACLERMTSEIPYASLPRINGNAVHHFLNPLSDSVHQNEIISPLWTRRMISSMSSFVRALTSSLITALGAADCSVALCSVWSGRRRIFISDSASV